MTDVDIILVVTGVLLPIGFAFHVFMSRRYIYPTWAKLASIIAGSAALGWGCLQWILLQGFQLTREAYHQLLGHRQLLAGLCIGIVLTILLSRPFKAQSKEQGCNLRKAKEGVTERERESETANGQRLG